MFHQWLTQDKQDPHHNADEESRSDRHFKQDQIDLFYQPSLPVVSHSGVTAANVSH